MMKKRSRAQATIASIEVTAKNVEALISLETEVRIAENAKTSAAAQIVAKQLGSQSIDVDGTVLGDGATGEFAAVKDVRITIDGIADITVRPGASPVELDKALTSARQAFDAELHRLDVDSVAQARQSAHVRADAEAVKAEADSTLTVLLGDDKRDTLEAALARAQADRSRPTEPTQTAAQTRAISTTSKQQSPRPRRAPRLLSLRSNIARAELERTRTSRDDARVETVRAQTSLARGRGLQFSA